MDDAPVRNKPVSKDGWRAHVVWWENAVSVLSMTFGGCFSVRKYEAGTWRVSVWGCKRRISAQVRGSIFLPGKSGNQ